MLLEGLFETAHRIDDPGDGHGSPDEYQEQHAARCLHKVDGHVARGFPVVLPCAPRERGKGTGPVPHRRRPALPPWLLGRLVFGRQVLEVENGITRLPQGQGNARGEAGPQQQRPGRLAGQLRHGSADVGPAALAGGQPDGDGSHQEMQDPADRKPGPRQDFEGARVRTFSALPAAPCSSRLMIVPSRPHNPCVCCGTPPQAQSCHGECLRNRWADAPEGMAHEGRAKHGRRGPACAAGCAECR